jgi:uncharacterized spore protein YtfJ
MAQEEPNEIIHEASIQAVLERLKAIYSTEIILGTPLEVDGQKIIPLAIAGFAFGQQGDAEYRGRMNVKAQGETYGAGGVMIPIGIIVVSGKDVKLLQVSKGFFEQLGGALAPLLVKLMNQPQTSGEGKRAPVGPKPSQGVNVARLLSNIQGFNASFRVLIIGLFLLGWLALIVVIDLFLPRQVTAIVSTLQQNFWQTALTGILSLVVVLFLSLVLTISLIGIPLTFVVIVLTCALTLFGSVGLALLVGRTLVAAIKQGEYSDVLLVLIGGIILGILGIIPVPLLGLLVWTVVSILGVGSVLLLQWKTVQKKSA